MSSRRRWTEEEDRQLRDMIAMGETLRAASVYLGRGYAATRRRASALGEARQRRWEPWEDTVVARNYASNAGVAAFLGRTPAAVVARRHRLRQQGVEIVDGRTARARYGTDMQRTVNANITQAGRS